MKKILLTLCPLLLFICATKAQVQEQNPTDISKKFFEIYAAKPMDAIDYLFSDVKKNKQISDDITAIKKNLKILKYKV